MSPSQPIRTITPPSSSHSGRGPWDYAVPIDDNENSMMNDYWKQYPLPNPKPSTNLPRQPLSHQTNGTSRYTPPKSDLSDSYSKENDSRAPNRVNNLRKQQSDISGNSDPDSLIDLYKTQSYKRSGSGSVDGMGGKRKTSQRAGRRAPEDDENNWIHRDKLAEIESKELEEAGFRVPRASTDRRDPGENYSRRDDKRQRRVSPVRTEEEANEEIEYGQDANDDDAYENSFSKSPPARPSGSRIPIPKGVAAPTTPSYRDRDSPKSRSRNGSNTWSSGENQRPRNGSVGSQALADEMETSTGAHTPLRSSSGSDKQNSPAKSPQKAKMPSKAGPNGKKTPSKTQTTSKSRNTSQPTRDSSTKRPGTSSGIPRPSTSHKPEGEAPWIASMYKPDPRLPPDQQMLPTHAKRLAQEQWEKEGKVGAVFDREFRLLSTDDFPQKRESLIESKRSIDTNGPPPNSPLSFTSNRNSANVPQLLSNKWPLTHTPPLGSPRSQASMGRPGTSGTDREHGGYRTMPPISKTQSPVNSSQVVTLQPVRVQDPPEPDNNRKRRRKEEAGCCTCVVM